MPHIFTPPVATHRAHSAARSLPLANNKRKKQKFVEAIAQNEDLDDGAEAGAKVESSANLEYTAIVTPQERHQRRVAGQPLDQESPPFPFPHAEDPSTKSRVAEQKRASNVVKASNLPQSLHLQHIAALTTIVHRALLKEDFARASRALGLLFREDAVSETVALRNGGFMGIAAEVLLRSGSSRNSSSHLGPNSLPFTHEGFEKAKRFYERLIVRHPYHKSWPNTVNAIDYYLAMFNLWIYVAAAENATASHMGEDAYNEIDASRKVRELEQANQIAQRLDTCMATVPYMDERELIRLRAMVALWVADLHENCADMIKTFDNRLIDPLVEQNSLSEGQQTSQEEERKDHLHEAGLSRDKAQELLSKLEGQARSDNG